VPTTPRELIEDCRSFPAVPAVVAKLYEAVGSASTVGIRDVGDIIEKDPSLVQRLLRLVNSPFYGLRNKVSTVSHAAAMVGLAGIRSLVLGIAVFDAFKAKDASTRFDMACFWRHSLAVASAARLIAAASKLSMPDEAYAAGVLHDVGRAILANFWPKTYEEILDLAGTGDFTYTAAEREVLGFTHTDIGSQALLRWGLPEVLREAVSFHHRLISSPPTDNLPPGRRLALLVSVADDLAWRRGFGLEFPDAAISPSVLRMLKRSHGVDVATDIAEGMEQDMRSAAEVLGVDLPDSGGLREQLEQANARLAELTAKVNDLAARKHSQKNLTAVLDRFAESVKHLMNSKEIIALLLRTVVEGAGFERALYLEFSPDKKRLHGQAFFDKTHFATDVTSKVLDVSEGPVAELVSGGKRLLVLEANESASALPAEFGSERTACAAVATPREALGVILADNFFSGSEIAGEQLNTVGMLADQAALGLESIRMYDRLESMKKLAETDGLTGVKNRRALLDVLAGEVARSSRYGTPLSLLMIDIDHFKRINDELGHSVGDRVLKEAGKMLVAFTRKVDVVGRYGGDEFVVVLPSTAREQAIICAERLHKGLTSLPCSKRLKDSGIFLSASIGGAGFDAATDRTPADLVERADKAMYAAKERGRDRVCFL